MPILSKLCCSAIGNKVLHYHNLARVANYYPCQYLCSIPHGENTKKRCVFTQEQCHYSSDAQKNFRHKTNNKALILISLSIISAGVSSWYIFQQRKKENGFRNISEFLKLKHSTDIIEHEITSNMSRFSFSTAKCASSLLVPGNEIPGLPTYKASDIAAHDCVEKRIWVCYKSGVYDITDFLPKHPGGDKILMAAGGALEPFWELFAIHKDPKVLEMLEEYRIGNLQAEDRGLAIENMNDPFAGDPRRHPVLKPRSVKPFNAEPPPELLVENFITPNELFFVRNHLPVPEVDPETYELEIDGIGIKPIHLTLNDLKTKFNSYTIVSTLQCAGNRRSELNEVREVKGLNWGSAAISNAEWTGVRLVDVLEYAGIKLDDKRIQHVQFEGLDTDPSNLPYGASIPAEKALDPKSDVILALKMNGEDLPKDHGYPVRVIAPGVVGARNVKWLGKIVVSEEESKSHWQKNDYKGFSPNTTWANVDFNTAPAIQELPVNSAICKPQENTKVELENGRVYTAGYAWSGGGRKIVRVDVSADGGITWHNASLKQDSSPLYRCWAWTLWTASIPVPEGTRKKGEEIEIICKAVDSAYNVQPDTFPPIWNLRGVLGNAWHRIKVKIQ